MTSFIEASRELNIKLVATNDTHYIEPEDWKAHEILLNIQSGEPCRNLGKRFLWESKHSACLILNGTPILRMNYYFKSPEADGRRFFKIFLKPFPILLEVAEKCHLELDFKTKHYPVYIPPLLKAKIIRKKNKKGLQNIFWKLCEEGIPQRYTPERLAKVKEIYPDRDPMESSESVWNYEMECDCPKGDVRLFSHCVGFYPLGQKQRHSRWALEGVREPVRLSLSDWRYRYRTFAVPFVL